MLKFLIFFVLLTHYAFAMDDFTVIKIELSDNKEKEIIDLSKLNCVKENCKVVCNGEVIVLEEISDDTLLSSEVYRCVDETKCEELLCSGGPIGACTCIKNFRSLYKAVVKNSQLPDSCPISPSTILANNLEINICRILKKYPAKMQSGIFKSKYSMQNRITGSISYAEVFYTI